MSVESWRNRMARALGFQFSGRRDLYEVLGYPREVLPSQLHAMYRRNDIANRIIRAFPCATWRQAPVIRDESGETVKDCAFRNAWEDLADRFKLINVIERADRLSGIGHYGLLVMGFRDGLRPDQPLAPGNHELLYARPYEESHITVTQWDTSPTSPRFGMPIRYTVQTGNVHGGGQTMSMVVHYTRCIHLAEVLDSDNLFGTPRLEPIFNRLQDLEKVVGGSAEAFWLLGNKGMALIADADANLTDEDKAAAKEQAEEYQHQLRRIMTLQGMTVQHLGSESPDPSQTISNLLDLIAGATGIPKRILIGSERGELASSQDENNWAARIEERRRIYADPCILRPLINMLIATGNLPKPVGAWWVEWENADSLGPMASADIALKQAQTIATYSAALMQGAADVVPPSEFREKLLGWDPQPCDAMLLDDEGMGA